MYVHFTQCWILKKKHYKENSFRTQNKPQNAIRNFTDICKKRDASAQTIIYS